MHGVKPQSKVHFERVKTHKLLQVCKKVVTNLFTSCRQVALALLVPSCCNKFGTSCYQVVAGLMALQSCSNKSERSFYRVYKKN
jgi:hypothetical protein